MGGIRILHIASTSTGGIGSNLLTLARRLDRRSFEQVFALPPDSTFYEDIASTGARMHPLSIDRSPLRTVNINGYMQIRRLIREGCFDIVHTHTSVGGFLGRVAARRMGVPHIVWTIHGWAFDYPRGRALKRMVFKATEAFLDRYTDRYVAISNNMKDVGVRAGITAPGKVEVIYHGVEAGDFDSVNDAGALRESLGFKGAAVIGTVARFEPQKAVDNLIRAASLLVKEHPQLKVLLVGDGPLSKSLERLASETGISGNITFTGWQKDVIRYVACMDVFCMPSLWEGFGIVLLEAMALAKPVVATRVGGVPEIVDEGKGGFLVPPGDPGALATRINNLLSDRALGKRMGLYNREKVETVFSADEMVRKYEAFYKRFFQGEKG